MKKKPISVVIKQIYATEYKDDTYIVALAENGKMYRAIHDKNNNRTDWTEINTPS